MKLIRSTSPVPVGRKKLDSIIAIRITAFGWNEKKSRYDIEVEDCEVRDVVAPEPGTPTKQYIPFERNIRTRTIQEVNDLFNHFGVDIVQGDEFTTKFRDLIVKSLLLDTQENPVYGLPPENWEIIDTDTEVA